MTEIVVSVLEQAIADKKAEQEKREQEKTKAQEIKQEKDTLQEAGAASQKEQVLKSSVLAGVDLSKKMEKRSTKKNLHVFRQDFPSFIMNFINTGFRWCWHLKAGMPVEKAEPSNG